MTRFEEKAIQKQEEAYREDFAVRAFNYSCELCCSQGKDTAHHGCANCPIKEAHVTALTAIRSGERKREKIGHTNYGAKKHQSRFGETIVMYSFNNCAFNNNTKEDK